MQGKQNKDLFDLQYIVCSQFTKFPLERHFMNQYGNP